MSEEPKSFRPTGNMITQIDLTVKENPAKYKGRSQFVRCAVIKLIREERGEYNVD